MRNRDLQKEDAIKKTALKMIAEEGLENLTMQKLARAANISPRTIYLKYENKEDLLVKLFIEEVLGSYEKNVVMNFDSSMDFKEGLRVLWTNLFKYFIANHHAFCLMQYGKISPLLNRAFLERDIKEGDYFTEVHTFLNKQIKKGVIKSFSIGIYRSLLFAPVMELVSEHFDHLDRSSKLVTPEVFEACLQAVIDGVLLKKDTIS
ncbi:TetR/AcrR family transcriptional regulator [Chitinophaga qingshengii]|uniref:TetR/AcrR family transcriptional regulator n=1 Tax=Chitinophaga qingshengii TaxID=1569794 RepID=A0ABR7TRS9_9BACT|nr:TetR/AcrR family transcriptional regulator [Chitinophaga qingshengii]MBC9932171.1 TetR/AcrR family transcriptional regulator [Chitinophaga qingshengii]